MLEISYPMSSPLNESLSTLKVLNVKLNIFFVHINLEVFYHRHNDLGNVLQTIVVDILF